MTNDEFYNAYFLQNAFNLELLHILAFCVLFLCTMLRYQEIGHGPIWPFITKPSIHIFVFWNTREFLKVYQHIFLHFPIF